MDFIILTDGGITEDRWREFEALEQYTWPEGDPGYLPPEYVRNLYSRGYDGMFLAVDPAADRLAGCFYAVFTDEEHFQRYMHGTFTDLESVPLTKDRDMILYLYTANLYPAYRGTSCMKELGRAFAAWLDRLEAEGYRFPDVYCECITEDGVRTAVSGFGMEPMNDTDAKGLGHYHCGDGLSRYRERMRRI